MANVKISDLTVITSSSDLANADVVPIVDSSDESTKRVALCVLNDFWSEAGIWCTGTNIAYLLTDCVGIGTATPGTDIMFRVQGDSCVTGDLKIGGDVCIGGDDLFMNTNTSGYMLVADGTNYNPVAMSGDIGIDSAGATTIQATSVDNSMLAGSIANAKLSNSSVSYGGVSLSLGGTDATPAFDLCDATAYKGDSALVTSGALNSGSITSGFGNIDNGSSTLDTGAATVSSLCAQGTVQVGVDGTGYDVKLFGDSAGAFMLYDESADTLDVRGATAAGPGVLKLTTGELTNVDGGILGRLEFQAPLDSAGTDACLVAASIWAEADATFSSSVNTTDLVFATAISATATEKMRITSTGVVKFNNAYCFPTADGTADQVLCTDGSGALSFATVAGGSSPWTSSGCFITTPVSCFVGIGSTAPGRTLDVYGEVAISPNTAGYESFIFSTVGASNCACFIIKDKSGDPAIVLASNAVNYINGGRVGIGTALPQEWLHVMGNIEIDNVAGYGLLKLQTGNGLDWGGDVCIFGFWSPTQHIIFDLGNTERMRITCDGELGIGTAAPNESLTLEAGVVSIKEVTTPTATTNYGKVYTKTDNKLYFQDGAGTEHELAFA